MPENTVQHFVMMCKDYYTVLEYIRKEGNVLFNNTLGKGPFRQREMKSAVTTWATLSN